jgi:hypothetical protein
MTAVADAGPESAAEILFRWVATNRPVAPHAGLHAVHEPAPAEPVDTPAPPTERPRMRLVPASPPARTLTATTPAAGPPPTLAERIHVLRASDRSLTCDETDDGRRTTPAEDPSLVVRRLAGASVEVIAGRRPAAQLARWLAPGVLDELRARATITRAAAPPLARAAAVRGVRVCTLHEHLVEGTAVVDDGRRVRAIALRLETHRGAWRATALEVG